MRRRPGESLAAWPPGTTNLTPVKRLAVLVAALACSTSAASAATPEVDARAYLVEEAQTGEVLLARRAHDRLPIASITKLMTVLVALERSKPGAMVSVDRDAVGVTGSTIRLRAGERLPLRDLVAAALIQSANDSAVALAEHVGGGDSGPFVEYMNQRAKALGLSETQFARPDGLDTPGHYSSAADVTRLALEAMQSRSCVGWCARSRLRSPAAGRSTPGTTSSASSPAFSASRPATPRARVEPNRGGARQRRHDLRDDSRQPFALRPQRRSRGAARAGGCRATRYVPLAPPDRVYGRIPVELGLRSRARRRRPAAAAAGPDRPPARRAGRRCPAGSISPSGEGHVRRRAARVRTKRLLGRTPLIAAEARDDPSFLERTGWYGGRTFHHIGGWSSQLIVTVT